MIEKRVLWAGESVFFFFNRRLFWRSPLNFFFFSFLPWEE